MKIEIIKVETKESEPCPNCEEIKAPCACMRNKCIDCGAPVGNITFTVCDDCWDKHHKENMLKAAIDSC